MHSKHLAPEIFTNRSLLFFGLIIHSGTAALLLQWREERRYGLRYASLQL